MGKCIEIEVNGSHGFICVAKTDFKCPKCECLHTEDDYYKQLDKSKHGLIYKKCKGCGTKLGITSDFKGDIHAWLKEEERGHF
jgi:hypothetical protein